MLRALNGMRLPSAKWRTSYAKPSSSSHSPWSCTDWIPAVPERKCQAENLTVVTVACQAALVPAVSAGTSVVVREVIPGRPARAVVLSHGAPCPLAGVRPPVPPGGATPGDLEQPLPFRG